MTEKNPQIEHWRKRIFAITWIAYFGFYLTRKAFSAAKSSLDMDVDETMLGLMDSAYLVAYALGQFVLGATADKKGPRQVLLWGLMGSIICSLLMGVFGMPQMFMVLMFVQGLCQSSGWAPLNKNMGYWFTRRERGSVMGFWCTNYAAGGAVASTLAAGAIKYSGGNWRFAFFVPAGCLLLIWLIFYKFQKDKPQDLGFPSIEEYKGEPVDDGDSEQEKVSWRKIIKKPMVGLLGASYFMLKPARYAILFWGPYYVAKKLQVGPVFSTVIANSFEVAGILGAIMGGVLSDKLFKSKRMPVCIICLGALTAVLFTFDGLVSKASKKVNEQELVQLIEKTKSESEVNPALQVSLKSLEEVNDINSEAGIKSLRLAIDNYTLLPQAPNKDVIRYEQLKVRLRKIYRGALVSTARSADLYKKHLRPLLLEVRQTLSKKDALRLQVESLMKVKKIESSKAVKKIFLLIKTLQQSAEIDSKYLAVVKSVQQELLEYMKDRGDNMSFYFLLQMKEMPELSQAEKKQVVLFLKDHEDLTEEESKLAFDSLIAQVPSLKPLQEKVNSFLLLRDNTEEEELNSAHYLMIFSLFLIGFFLYAPDSVISGLAAIDFGGHQGASSAAGFVNGCGSVSAIFSGVGVGYIAQHYSWGTLFNIFGFMTLIGTLLLLPKWNAVPAEHQLNSTNKKES